MKKRMTFQLRSFCSGIILLGGLLLNGFSVKAQCYEDFYVYQVSPYGQLCSPQQATLRAEYYPSDPYGYVAGEFRWYTSETDPFPVQTDYIYSDFGSLTADYSMFATNGATVWTSFYNYNTGCESYRWPYSFYISPTPYLYQDFANKCGYDVAKIQLSSNVSGVTFQLYKLYEYYDPNWGYTQEYQYIQGNSTDQGLTIGRTAMINNNGNGVGDAGTWVHESYHYYQQLTQGWAGQFMNGIHEQWWLYPFKGIKIYDLDFANKYNEAAASYYEKITYPRLK